MKEYYDLLYTGRLDELVEKTLPIAEHEPDAARAFLRMLMARENLFLLSAHSIDLLREAAHRGERYGQYGYARYHVSVRPDENSLWEAYRQAEAAMEQGIADGKAMIALTYSYGDIGKVDWEKESQLMQEAYEAGSELATMYIVQDLCYGKHYQSGQPEKAGNMLDELMAKEEAEGIEPNGWWPFYKAVSLPDDEVPARIARYYERAIELGVLKAYGQLVLLYGYNDGAELNITDQYTKWLRAGLEHRSANAYYLDAAREMMRYNDLHPKYMAQKLDYDIVRECEDAIYGQLCEAVRLGSLPAMETLGDMYYHGWYNCAQNYQRAFTCYSSATNMDSYDAAEKLWLMMHDHLIDRPLDYQDSIALMGCRWGSKRLLAETVIAHQEGRLTEYDKEITKYYEPIFDSPDFSLDEFGSADDDFPDDDDPDDDGRFDAWA